MLNKNDTLRSPSVVIIGAGMTGILMTIKLREAGITDITILEKKENIGGTWRENTYPGVACDIPAHMYTYSFEPNPDWSHRFAEGEEIQAYFEKVGRKYGVTESIRFNELVTSCIYKDSQWTVTTSSDATLVADFVINCTGILHHPAKPSIKGLETFKGACFHTAEWDKEFDFSGKKVGVIGTGSTAVQLIPEVAKLAGKVSVFQRTAQWIAPVSNKKFSERTKAFFRSNAWSISLLNKAYAFGIKHTLTKGVSGHKLQHAFLTWLCKRNLENSISDPVLREKLTPDYEVGCKRLVINNTFYDAVQRDNVDLVTEGIQEITARGVVTNDGVEHELDVLVLSTGFDPFAFMRPMDVRGLNGLEINTAWKDKIQGYRSVIVPNFPNFFLMLGPNTPIGNYSVIAMSEVQADYVLKLIDKWREKQFDALDIKPEALKNFNQYLKAGMKGTAWTSGCQSWYLDGDGDPVVWPYTWDRWVKEMKTPDMDDFIQIESRG